MVGEILLLTKHCNPLRLQKKNHFHSVQLIPLPYTEILTTWFLLMEGRLLPAIKYIYICFYSLLRFQYSICGYVYFCSAGAKNTVDRPRARKNNSSFVCLVGVRSAVFFN